MATYCPDCGKPVELVDWPTEWLPTCIGCGTAFRDAEQFGWIVKAPNSGGTDAMVLPVPTIEVRIIRAGESEEEKPND